MASVHRLASRHQFISTIPKVYASSTTTLTGRVNILIKNNCLIQSNEIHERNTRRPSSSTNEIRQFSSTTGNQSDDKNKDGNQGEQQQKQQQQQQQQQQQPSRSGPVMVARTPRSAAASKLRKDGTEPSNNSTTNNTLKPSDSMVNRIISGGTPCDPAPPPFRLADFGEESLYTLVLLRHGESEWNKLNRYTGWCDVELTKQGEKEARDAGRLLHEYGIEIDHAFTSVLKRASFSCNMALNTAKQHWVPVTKTWRLNERHYGGKSKLLNSFVLKADNGKAASQRETTIF